MLNAQEKSKVIKDQSIRKSLENVVFCIAVFSAMLIFFTVLHPIPIMDEDDVIYTVIVRKAIPIPGSWNPSRMMPEVLTSLCGNLAALCTAFGFGRFIDCQVVVYGLLFSLFITAYVWAFFQLLEKRFFCSRFQAVCLSILFLMLHFLVFRTETSRNNFMFHTYDACCVFYYTVPALLGCSLVMWLMAKPDNVPALSGRNLVKESFLLLLLYFEVFSNLFGSVILAAYAGYRLLRNLIVAEKKREHTRREKLVKQKKTEYPSCSCGKQTFWEQNTFWLGIIFSWFLAVALEATGGRAAGTRTQVTDGKLSLSIRIGQVVSVFVKAIWNSNLLFRLMIIAILIMSVILTFIRMKRIRDTQMLCVLRETIVWGGFTFVAVLLLCAVVEPLYASRPEVVFPIMFVLFFLLMIGIIYILQTIPFLSVFLPAFLIIVYSMTNTRFLTFRDSNPLLLDGHVAVAIENEIYESIIADAEAGKTETTVKVLHSSESGNWPHDGLIGDPMAKFFLKYGVIKHEIRVHTKPSDEMNEKYNVPVP